MESYYFQSNNSKSIKCIKNKEKLNADGGKNILEDNIKQRRFDQEFERQKLSPTNSELRRTKNHISKIDELGYVINIHSNDRI